VLKKRLKKAAFPAKPLTRKIISYTLRIDNSAKQAQERAKQVPDTQQRGFRARKGKEKRRKSAAEQRRKA